MFGVGPLSDCFGRYQFKNGLYEEHDMNESEFLLSGSDDLLADLSTSPEKLEIAQNKLHSYL